MNPKPNATSPIVVVVPHETLTRNLAHHDPDLLVSTDDQFYEGSSTRVENRKDPGLDYLYKWCLWLWAFRDLTRSTPTIVLVDDHDLFQQNFWGAKGKKTLPGKPSKDGYVGTSDFVNRVIRTQCGHNPNPYDPTPIKRGISVYYSAFTYGGTSFALLQSRAFKHGPKVNKKRDSDNRVLLGERQQRFLEAWVDQDRELPKICLTQTIFSNVLTTPRGNPVGGHDTYSYPPRARDRALKSLRKARALMLVGDQHFPSLVRHGIDDHTDGVVQFTGPAGNTLYQQWFVPEEDSTTEGADANTGKFVDGHNNKLRTLAVMNPKLPFRKAVNKHGSRHMFDQQLKSDGYGIVHVNHDEEVFYIECWPQDTDPTTADAEQFLGWPYRLPFDEVDGW